MLPIPMNVTIRRRTSIDASATAAPRVLFRAPCTVSMASGSGRAIVARNACTAARAASYASGP